MLNIGVIGYGTRINFIVQELINTGEVKLVSVADINCAGVKESFRYGVIGAALQRIQETKTVAVL